MLLVTRDQQVKTVDTNQVQLAALDRYSEEISKGNPLLRAKVVDIAASMHLERDLDVVNSAVEQDLRDGLITHVEAVQTKSAVQSFHNGTTDSKVSFVTFQQQLIVLQYQMQQLRDQISNGLIAIKETDKNLLTARNVVSTLDDTAMHVAFDGRGSNMAFVPYDNLKAARVGAPVYDCYLMVIFCRNVGTITHVYHDEQLVEFPLFNVRFSHMVRGVMVDIDVTRPKAMYSSILFVGSKPLLF